jgi:hypothetical protein
MPLPPTRAPNSSARFAVLLGLALLPAGSLLAGCRIGYDELPLSLGGLAQGGATTGSTTGTGGTTATELGGEGNDVGAAGDSTSLGSSTSNAGSSSTNGGSAVDGGTGSGGSTTGGTGGGGTSSGGTGSGGSTTGGAGPTGCRTATYAGHDYEMCDVGASYATAAADCASRGAKLVRIDDAAENTWVHSMIPAADQANNNTNLWRWLGGDDLAAVGEWSWADGTLFWTGGNKGASVGGAYANWTKNQPLNADCLAMMARDGSWYAMDCAAARPYVCELY